MRFTGFACLAMLVLSVSAGADDGFESLFNGKDLTGWDGNPELWSVEDGAITGTTRGPGQLKYNQFLVWTGGKVADFELRLEFRLEGDNNTGVQYRSRRMPENGDWSVGGYQADIHSNPPYTGMLYDERGRGILAERGQKVVISNNGQKDVSSLGVPVEPIDLTKWHELTIIAEGDRLTHKIDGVTAVEVIDKQESERDLEGVIALQVHIGKEMKAQFRNIRLKRLGAEKAASSAPAAPEAVAASTEPQLIWLKHDGKDAGKAYFRKEFKIDGEIESARISVAADDRAVVFLDRQELFMHESAEWVKSVDVTEMLKARAGQTHVLGIDGSNWYAPAAVLVQLDVKLKDKGVQTIVTDGTWTGSIDGSGGWKNPGFKGDEKGWKPVDVVGKLGDVPWNLTAKKIEIAVHLRPPEATPIDALKLPEGFKAELLYSVPKEVEGSWVNMCADPKGRLIVSDQYGGLFRLTPPGIMDAEHLRIEKIDVPIGEAQGLLWAFDSLYVVVNSGGKFPSGVYRVRDTDGDDQLDTLDTLRLLEGKGEHGPHAALLSPDGKSIHIVCGNATKLTEFETSRVPQIWDEDSIIPRVWGKAFMKGTPPPGGFIAKMDPDGNNWELVSAGFRNQYDAAFNADGELFAYDADMEWDMNTPWYRPTRVCLVQSGVDFGWRTSSAKFLNHFPEALPPVLEIGPGSPTGVCFGYGTKFPAKYQEALYICDWSYGKLYAVHIQPEGASYSTTLEDFVTATPLPLTDVVANPVDGALYFTIGGRKVQSGLYRVTYVGSESTEPVDAKNEEGAADRTIRHKLEALHVGDHPDAVEIAWPYLSHADRSIRYAARTAIEHRPALEWQERALMENNTQAKLESLLALCRVHERPTRNPEETVETYPPAWDAPSSGPEGAAGELQKEIFASLEQLHWRDLTHAQKIAALRIAQLAILRFGQPSTEIRDAIVAHLEEALPAETPELNNFILDLAVNLQAPYAVERGVALLEAAPSQEEQINYAKALRFARYGWTPELLETYFKWFVRASGYRGGAGFGLYVTDIQTDALKLLTEEQIAALQPILDMKPEGQVNPFAAEPRPFVKQWTMDELVPILDAQLKNRDFDHGRKMFGAANCFACHRFNGEGGAMGPDLTSLAGRFDFKAILESVLTPSKEISDQYAAVQIQTMSGKVVVGRVINLFGDTIRVNTNMLDPDMLESVDRKEIEEMMPSPLSMMPSGLLDTLNQEEVLDLMAFLLSRGDREHPMFKKSDSQANR